MVDEKAMIEVLENRAIRACGLDVIEIEPRNRATRLIRIRLTPLLIHKFHR